MKKMRKNVLLMLACICLMACLFALSINAAEPSYADGEWIYAADGVTKLTLRDTDGNPLIWYMNGEELKYVRADQTNTSESVYVVYEISAGGSGFDQSVFKPEKTLKKITIFDNGVEIICCGANLSAQKLVLANLEKLDIDALNGWLFGNKNGCCPMLRGIYLPSTLKGIGQEGFTNTKLVQVWNLENTQLFYMNACNPFATSTFTQEATGGVFKNPPTMTTPLNIQYSQVITYIMSPNLDYPDMNLPSRQYFRACNMLQTIVLPASARVGFGEEAFRQTPAQFVVFMTGTEQDAIDMIANTKDRTAHDNARFLNAKIISYETYLSDKSTYDNSTSQVYVVYGYDYCEAFFDGKHNPGEETMEFNSYFEAVRFSSVCQNGCGLTVYNDEKEISAMFTWLGYSISEFADAKGAFSVSQSYRVNKAAIDKYTAVTDDSFVFGVLATGNSTDGAVSPQLGDQKVLYKEFEAVAYDCFEIKVSGINSDELKNRPLIFCAYVIDGENMHYLNGEADGSSEEKVYKGATVTELVGISYNDLAN